MLNKLGRTIAIPLILLSSMNEACAPASQATRRQVTQTLDERPQKQLRSSQKPLNREMPWSDEEIASIPLIKCAHSLYMRDDSLCPSDCLAIAKMLIAFKGDDVLSKCEEIDIDRLVSDMRIESKSNCGTFEAVRKR